MHKYVCARHMTTESVFRLKSEHSLAASVKPTQSPSTPEEMIISNLRLRDCSGSRHSPDPSIEPEIKYDVRPKASVELLDTGFLLIGEQTWLEVMVSRNCDNDIEVLG
jgi:hypothetical protein